MDRSKGFVGWWIAIGSLVILVFMAPLVADVFGSVGGLYNINIGFFMIIALPVLFLALLYKLATS